MPLPINLWLIHPDQEICAAFRDRFAQLPNVRVVRSRYEDLEPHDCFVTAANSFGIMNAGIDAAVIGRFGETLMQRVQHRILDEYLGEQPIGTCFIEPTGDSDYPFVAHAPTMRTPGCIQGTDRVYTATFASLTAVYRHNTSRAQAPARTEPEASKPKARARAENDQVALQRRIDTVVFPAMGAGFGGVAGSEAARQMAVAYQHYLAPPHRMNWDMVARRQKSIAYDNGRRVVD